MTVLEPEGSRQFARRVCRDCGSSAGFAPAPVTPDRARKFTLWFGKHKGRSLAEVLETDPAYLRWLADTLARDDRRSYRKVAELARVLIATAPTPGRRGGG